ncbi:RloB family protein [Caminibacter pacificus]
MTAIKKSIKDNEKKYDEEEYDQIWAVFDKDEVKDEHFDKSIRTIRKNKYKVAYSNPCFELWFLLHFNFYQTSLTKNLCLKKLKNYIPKYEKNDKNMYDKLKNKVQIAIRNAKKLEKINKSKKVPHNKNPYTNVYKLVEELRKYEK